MARLPRLDFPGVAQHIVQRGNDRQACFADDADYLLTCYRYIELSPVRADMGAASADYRWSSHTRNAFGAHEPRISPHPLYLGLGASDAGRQQAYRTLLKSELCSDKLNELRAHTRQQKAWGSDRFHQQIGALRQRRAVARVSEAHPGAFYMTPGALRLPGLRWLPPGRLTSPC